MARAGRPVGTTGQARVLDEKELKRVLINVAAGKNAARNTAIVVLSNYLGLRAKELAALKIGDVVENDRLKTVLRLVAAYTKGAKHRDVSLENKAVINALTAYIDERRAEHPTLSPGFSLFRPERGGNFSPNSMVRVLGDIYRNAGFADASSHTGRRSLITRLAYAGIDLNSVRQIAGHSSIVTTQRYIQDNPQLMADILKAVK